MTSISGRSGHGFLFAAQQVQAQGALSAVVVQEWEEGDGEYVAPELLRGCGPSPAADVYSLGATIYECLTGTS